MSKIDAELAFDGQGLIPAIVQSTSDRHVLMLAYMNRESLEKTIETGEVHFWSRSRKELWRKGETSGNVMKVTAIRADCDLDCLLIEAEPAGPACHTGRMSCFHHPLVSVTEKSVESESLGAILRELSAVIGDRKRKRPADSYTSKLFDGGVDRIAKKFGEESVEVVIAAKNGSREELTRESADLLYHLLVLWEQAGLTFQEVAAELRRRRG